MEDSELDTSTYSGQKVSSVGKKKVSLEDDKSNKNTGSMLPWDDHAAVSDSGVKESAMDSKKGHTAVAQSKEDDSNMKEKEMTEKTENILGPSEKYCLQFQCSKKVK